MAGDGRLLVVGRVSGSVDGWETQWVTGETASRSLRLSFSYV